MQGRPSRLSEVVKVGQTASGCDDVEQLRNKLLDVLLDIFHADRASFYLSSPSSSPRLDLDNVAVRGTEQKYADLFRRYYWKLDPIFKAIQIPKTIVPFKDLICCEDMLDGEWYNGFLKPQSVCDLIAINLRVGKRLLGVLCLLRSKDQCPFARREMVKGELIAPHLAAAIDKASFLDRARKAEAIIGAICSDLPYAGIVVLDESFAPVYANEEARNTLLQSVSGRKVSEVSNTALLKVLHSKCQELLQAPAGRSVSRGIERVDLVVKGEKGSTPANIRLVQDSKGSRLCLICIGGSRHRSVVPEHAKRYGLTQREQEIVGCVCEGLKNGEIAEKLFICEGTVENHLHAIYEKLGVKNRTSLVNFVAGLQYSQ
jgi:DNA-binding CsgD family transcriptional regulator